MQKEGLARSLYAVRDMFTAFQLYAVCPLLKFMRFGKGRHSFICRNLLKTIRGAALRLRRDQGVLLSCLRAGVMQRSAPIQANLWYLEPGV